MKKYLILFLLVGVSFISCNKEDAIEEEEVIMVPFVGKWSGITSGDNTGTFIMTIRSDGGITMESRILTGPFLGDFSISGNVTVDGVIDESDNRQGNDSFSWSGTLEPTRGGGIWSRTIDGVNLKGNWVVEKDD